MRRMKRIKFVQDVVSVMVRRIQRLKCVLVSYDAVTSHRIKCINYDNALVMPNLSSWSNFWFTSQDSEND